MRTIERQSSIRRYTVERGMEYCNMISVDRSYAVQVECRQEVLASHGIPQVLQVSCAYCELEELCVFACLVVLNV